ncbi:MAG: phosphatase [Candidatus Methanofastidiosa archaeon]|jgi:O-acetyl-ADP-ribose deacetylase (regulator of RNase III)|nr:phosphatase [Candidatus Methanofastidiosa archaeon]
MKEITGNLITLAKEGHFDMIVHGCNCFCTMGSGIAKEIRQEFPGAYAADCKTIKGDRNKLGAFTYYDVVGDEVAFRIINAYTQYNYGREENVIYVDYNAVTNVFKKLNDLYPRYRIGLPKIGAGLAGGDWDKIKNIISETLTDMDVTIVYLPN